MQGNRFKGIHDDYKVKIKDAVKYLEQPDFHSIHCSQEPL